jgi:hypothetical protein
MTRPVLPVALLGIAAVLAALPAPAQEVRSAPGAVLRWLDKMAGAAADIEIRRGQPVTRGRLTILLDDCRYPADNPGGEAWAHLTIHDSLVAAPVFVGWMIASSPALSALDHARYDVWVLRCATD